MTGAAFGSNPTLRPSSTGSCNTQQSAVRRAATRADRQALECVAPPLGCWPRELLGVVQVDWWQVAYLTFRKGEPNAVVNVADGADRNGHRLFPPEVALVEEDVCEVMIGRVDHESLDPSDCSVSGVDVLPAAHLHFPDGHD